MVSGSTCPSVLFYPLDLGSKTVFSGHRSSKHGIVIIEAFLSFGIGQMEFLTWKVHISPFCDRKEGGNGYMSETFLGQYIKKLF